MGQAELRNNGVLRSSPMWRSQKFGSEGCYSLSQKFRKKIAHFPPLHPIFIGNSLPCASIKTNGVEEARHKGGKDRGKGIAARSQREHRKESVSMPSLLLCELDTPYSPVPISPRPAEGSESEVTYRCFLQTVARMAAAPKSTSAMLATSF